MTKSGNPGLFSLEMKCLKAGPYGGFEDFKWDWDQTLEQEDTCELLVSFIIPGPLAQLSLVRKVAGSSPMLGLWDHSVGWAVGESSRSDIKPNFMTVSGTCQCPNWLLRLPTNSQSLQFMAKNNMSSSWRCFINCKDYYYWNKNNLLIILPIITSSRYLKMLHSKCSDYALVGKTAVNLRKALSYFILGFIGQDTGREKLPSLFIWCHGIF